MELGFTQRRDTTNFVKFFVLPTIKLETQRKEDSINDEKHVRCFAYSFIFQVHMRHNLVYTLPPSLILALVGGFCGCSSMPTMTSSDDKLQPEIIVEVAEEYQYASIQVDIIGISQAEYPIWANKPVSEYFNPSDRTRTRAIKKTMTFYASDNAPKALSNHDILWDQWAPRDIAYLVVLADIPGKHIDQHGSLDQRRLFLPLNANHWANALDAPIILKLSPEGIITTPAFDASQAQLLAIE